MPWAFQKRTECFFKRRHSFPDSSSLSDESIGDRVIRNISVSLEIIRMSLYHKEEFHSVVKKRVE